MRLSPGIVGIIIVSVVPAVVAFAVLAFLARMRRGQLWFVPGGLAAAALAPVFSTFFAIRMVIGAFQGMATRGGGIGAVSAGMWEATQPILFSLYLSSALTAVTFVMAIRSVVDRDDDEVAGADRKGSIVSMSLLLLAAVGAIATVALFQSVTAIIISVIDPKATPTFGIAETSSLIASRLLLTSGTSLFMTLALLAGIGVVAGVQPERPPSAALAKLFVFVALVAVLASAGSALVVHASAKRLYNAALTGRLSP